MSLREEQGYLDMLRDILDEGVYRKDKGDDYGRHETFAVCLKFDLRGGKVPLFTTKKTFARGAFEEMMWFLSGSQNIQQLWDRNVRIWDKWANKDGEVGPLYGYQWRHWHVDPRTRGMNGGRDEIDQLDTMMQSLRDRPEARSHMMTNWRPDHLKPMSIKPCHGIHIQAYRNHEGLRLLMTQRSCDAFLGVPFNVFQYSMLAHMMAHQLGCEAVEFTWVGGDVHVYENHVDQVREQISRPPYAPPIVRFNRKPRHISGYQFHDMTILNYVHHPALTGEVSAQGRPGMGVTI